MSPAPGRAPRDALREATRYAQVGMMIVAPMAALGWVGYRLDRRWETSPWLFLAGLLLGMAGGFVSFFRFVLPPRGDGGRAGGGGE